MLLSQHQEAFHVINGGTEHLPAFIRTFQNLSGFCLSDSSPNEALLDEDQMLRAATPSCLQGVVPANTEFMPGAGMQRAMWKAGGRAGPMQEGLEASGGAVRWSLVVWTTL